MSKKSYPIIGTKSSLLWDEDTDAWVYISGEPVRDNDPRAFYKIIPTLYRAVDLRASAISNLPWALMKGETEYETSADYQNKEGLVSSMVNMLYLIEASLVLAGCAYWKREKNRAGYDKLRHLDPSSMTLIRERAEYGDLAWKRNEGSTTREYTTKEIIYFYYPDPYVEIGPPGAWPAKSALNACGVLANMDEFARNYFGRGAIKAMLFAMSGASEGEAKKFEAWWNKFISGIKNAFRTKVINAEKVEPVIVGEGIKELENVTLSQEKREEIAISMAIPMSILFANAATYATAERDKLNWYEDKVLPEANWIAAVLNEQLFKALNLRLVFKPESLDIFQEDEEQRAGAMSQFMDAVTKAGSLEMAQAMFLIYGVDIDDEAMALIEKHFAAKQEQAAEIQENIANAPPKPDEQKPPEQEDEPEEEYPEKAINIEQLQRELSLWQSKCLSAVKRGNPASSVAFVPVNIQPLNYERITAGLAGAQDADGVRAAFVAGMLSQQEGLQGAQSHQQDINVTSAEKNAPGASGGHIDPLEGIWVELKRANDLLLASAPQPD
jgi:phage portal protein BeeE